MQEKCCTERMSKNDAGMRQGRNHVQPPSFGGVAGGVAYLVDLEFSRQGGRHKQEEVEGWGGRGMTEVGRGGKKAESARRDSESPA